MRPLLLAVLGALVLPGCTTMVNDTYQKISIHTPGVENVQCILESEGNKYRMLAPGVVQVDRQTNPLNVTCEKAGYLTTATTLEPKIRMVPAQMNVLNGIIPGTAYDFASESVYAYQDVLVVNMVQDPNRVILPPKEVHVLQLKKEVVTPQDVMKEKGVAADDLFSDDPLDTPADKAFSEGLRK